MSKRPSRNVLNNDADLETAIAKVAGFRIIRVTSYLKVGLDSVARGIDPDRDCYFAHPTALKNASPETSIVQEEVFGPVVAATPWRGREMRHAALENYFQTKISVHQPTKFSCASRRQADKL